MIAIKLMGGLGNQMFQYAVARHLSIKNKTQLILDTSWFKEYPSTDTPRKYELNLVNVKGKVASNKTGSVSSKYMAVRVIQRNLIKRPLIVAEKDFTYDKNILDLTGRYNLNGFFQSHKYFNNIRDILLKEFQPNYKLSKSVRKDLGNIINSNVSVSIHIRRGDYISNKYANSFHGVAGLDYYHNAINRISQMVKGTLDIFVFSDDLEWCKDNLFFENHSLNFVDSAKKTFDDMWLMSHCKHNVIANSSYSWWGAWLNQNPGKAVIAPKTWFQDKTHNTKDLLPEEWIKL